MTSPLLDSELSAIAERAEAATPGPWSFIEDEKGYAVYANDSGAPIARPHPIDHVPEACALAEFIAAARTDIPRLIAEIKRLKGAANG